MRKIRKFLLWLTLVLTFIFGAVSLFLYFNQDKLIQKLITEANKRLAVPIEVKNISINWYQDFPNIAVICEKVRIQEAVSGSKESLAELQQLSFSFDISSLIKGNYTLDKVKLKDGAVTIRNTIDGQRNYLILKKSEDSNSAKRTINFKLDEIDIKGVDINYLDEKLDQNYYLYGNELKAKLVKKNENYLITVEGEIKTKALNIQTLTYFQNKELKLNLQMNYNEDTEQLDFNPSKLSFNKNEFSINGGFNIASSFMNLSIDGINTDLETISSLLPNEYHKLIESYDATGEAIFKSSIVGELSSLNSPLVNIQFAVKNGKMKEPTYNTKVDSLNLTGSYSNGRGHSLRTSTLQIETAYGLIKGKTIQTTFTLTNFDKLHLKLSADGSIATHDLFSFFPNREDFSGLGGLIDFNINLNGDINNFKKASTAHKIDNSGEILLSGVEGIYKQYPLPFKDISGRLLFNKNDIAINGLSGKIGVSDLEVNGFFLNIIPYLLNDSESLLIEAATNSKYIDINELLSGLSNESYSEEKQQASYKFSISPFLQLDLKSKIDKLIFQRFEGRSISGNIQVKNQVLLAKDLKANTMGGKIKLSGSIDTEPLDIIDIRTTADFEKLNIDSIFYTFKDFSQDFLTQKHLKGKINAEVLAHIVLDKSLNFKSDEFEASILASIQEGKLINFEPMQSLSDYVNEKDLANLSFGEMKNSIQIKNKTIYLPEMLIKSNISEIEIQGTHTFDQAIDYSLLVPLKNYKRQDKDAAFGAIEETDEYTKLFLKITGTTDDFEVSWDAKKTLKSVGTKLKEEAKNIKNIITGKETDKQKKKEIEVKEDDYFDW